MIQINLLPDIKRQYLKSQRIKQLFIMGAFVTSAATVAGVVLVWLFTLGQNIHMDRLQKDIDKKIAELQSVQDLDKVVTIQNQLAVIEQLRDQKPDVAQLFNYLSVVTPNDIDLGAVEVEFIDNQTLEITGLGKDFKAINTFTDTLKNATYTHSDTEDDIDAFSSVVLVGQGDTDDSGKISFNILVKFDQGIFDNNLSAIKLTVPKITSTQSETERPKSLFDPGALQNTEPIEEEEGSQ